MNREFVERSLVDLEREHDAGDLTDDDYAALKARYHGMLDEARPAPAPAPRRPALATAVVAAVVVVAVAAGVLMARSAGRRDPGENVSGGGPAATQTSATTTTLPASLAACRTLSGGAAIDCFTTYTTEHPDDPRGFVEFGLFSVNAGLGTGDERLLDAGETFLERAIELDADHVEARVYLALLHERTGRLDEAAADLEALRGADVPVDLQPLVAMVEAGVSGDRQGGGTEPP